jgi:hypothetical protein
VDESDGLENRCGRKVTVGSNPTSSAQPDSRSTLFNPRVWPTADVISALQQPATAPLVTVTGKLISWKKPIPEYSFEAFENVVAM